MATPTANVLQFPKNLFLTTRNMLRYEYVLIFHNADFSLYNYATDFSWSIKPVFIKAYNGYK